MGWPTNRYTLAGTSYDSDGNLLNDTFHSYTWNVFGRPATVDSITRTYDAFYRIVEQNPSGTFYQTVYNPIDDNAYAPFGEPYAQTGNGEISFTGQNKDTTWLQYDFLARQYSPSQGRWLSPDPAGVAVADLTNPQSWNRYAYVLNSPLNFTDRYGLCYQDFLGVVDGAAVFGTDNLPCFLEQTQYRVRTAL